MNAFTRSIAQIFKNAWGALKTFSASIGCAIAFAVVTMIRIQLDWPEQEAWNFLFNCLHWSFALGALSGLAAITAAQNRYNTSKAFMLANILTVLAAGAAFVLLYTQGADLTASSSVRYVSLTRLAVNRVIVAMVISFLSFILLAGRPAEQSDFARALFMTLKAFFIAALYGVVLMAGASAVAGAVENLLYHNMSEKVYMYIATIAGFLAFTIFVGYFPDFRKGAVDSRRETAQKQPQFIEILFTYILIPIMLALTLVLLLWAGRTIFTGSWPVFEELSGIATTYAVCGIWLHMMVTHHDTAPAGFYRRIYPIAALVILAFQAFALVNQLSRFGLKNTEYAFTLLWIITVTAAVLLILKKERAHLPIVLLICAVSLFSVLPVVGYYSLPVRAQVARLENLLTEQGILKDNQLIPAVKEPNLAAREGITDAVSFLARAENTRLPAWFDTHLSESETFKTQLGFEQTWPKEDPGRNPRDYLGLNLTLPSGAIDVRGYDWVLTFSEDYRQNRSAAVLEGSRGTYRFDWIVDAQNGLPRLEIFLNDTMIHEQDLNSYIDQVMKAHPLSGAPSAQATLEDMRFRFENEDVTALIVFRNIDINIDPQNDEIHYWLYPQSLYVHENP